MKPFRHLSDSPVELGYWTFVLAMIVLVFHQTERLAQIIQKYEFGRSFTPGLFGASVDAELTHFVYDGAAFCCVVAVWVVYYKNPGIWRESSVGLLALSFTLALQAFQLAFQAMRFVQHVGGGAAPQGIVGHVAGSVDLPFWIGSVVLASMALAYGGFRPSPTHAFANDGSAG